MYELNEVKLIGYVGKTPATSAEGKKPFAAFDLATTKRYTPQGENAKAVEETHWHKVICYGALATKAKSFVSKGSHLLVCGVLENFEWTHHEAGEVHKGTRILAGKLVLLQQNKAGSAA